MTYAEMEKCITELKKEMLTQGYKSIMHFDMQKYGLMLSIKNNEPLTQADLVMIKNRYIYDYEFAKLLIDTNWIDKEIKDKIVECFCNNKIQGCTNENKGEFINSVLCNYPDISTAIRIYYDYHDETMECMIKQSRDNRQFEMPQEIIDSLLRLELDVINNVVSKPIDYKMQATIFSLTKNGYTAEYILKNMPINCEIAEAIATQLINSQHIDNETKDLIFNIHGCNPQDLSIATPHIVGELYMSVVDTAFREISSSGSIAKEILHRTEARDLLDSLVYKRLMTEPIECDYVNRIISQNKKEGRFGSDEKIKMITMKTKNPKTLSIIIESSMNMEDKNFACDNPNTDEADIKKHAKSYCDRIRKKQENSTSKRLPEHWISIINNAIRRTTLNTEDYETVLKTKHAALFQELVSSRKVPKDIFEKAKSIIYEQAKVSSSNSWDLLKLQVAVNEIMLEKDIKDQSLLNSMCQYITDLAIWFNVSKDLENAYINFITLKENPELKNELKDILIKAVERADYRPSHNTQTSFIYAIDEAITKILEKLNWKNGKQPTELMTDNELYRERKTIVINLLEDIRYKPETMLEAIENMYKRYLGINDELKNRQIETSIEEER